MIIIDYVVYVIYGSSDPYIRDSQSKPLKIS